MVVADSTIAPAPIRFPRCHDVHVMAAIPTAWGTCGIVWKNHENESVEYFSRRPADARLCRIYTPGLTLPDLRRQILTALPGCQEVLGNRGHFHPETVPEWFDRLVAFLQSYYRAGLRHTSPPELEDHWAYWRPRLHWDQLTAFQRRVLEVVALIPTGTKMTYGQVAQRIGRPAAARAVGAAVGANPWPVLVPCHRVLGAGGRLTGFSAPGGVGTKRRMLELEAG